MRVSQKNKRPISQTLSLMRVRHCALYRPSKLPPSRLPTQNPRNPTSLREPISFTRILFPRKSLSPMASASLQMLVSTTKFGTRLRRRLKQFALATLLTRTKLLAQRQWLRTLTRFTRICMRRNIRQIQSLLRGKQRIRSKKKSISATLLRSKKPKLIWRKPRLKPAPTYIRKRLRISKSATLSS